MKDRFLNLCGFLEAHCFKDGEICKYWSHDYVSHCCNGVSFEEHKPKCTLLPKNQLKKEENK